ncbi:MAG: hypothetical protein L0Z50_39270 [Verrucomicrobiales bacterium]|nr:hypothetical protein [Verrucomicrobiales bacterium]
MKHRTRVAKRQRGKPRYRFTKEDCQRGYQAALAKCMEDWDLYAWLWRKLRRHYKRKEQS